MKTIKICIISILLFCNFTSAEAVKNLHLSGNLGMFLYHADNSLPITEDGDLKTTFGLSLGYEFPFNEKYDLQIDCGYFRSSTGAMDWEVTDEYGNPTGIETITLTHQSYPVDVCFTKMKNEEFDYGFGPSFVGTTRTLYCEFDVPYQNEKVEMKDRLASLGVGAIGFFRYNIPLGTSQKHSLFYSLKSRLITTIWFHEADRQLSDYNLNYIQIEFSVGLKFNKN